jgi:hypothetical protein
MSIAGKACFFCVHDLRCMNTLAMKLSSLTSTLPELVRLCTNYKLCSVLTGQLVPSMEQL